MKSPDISGPVALAWAVSMRSDKKHGTVAQYMLDGPFHPFWNRWIMLVVHLRPVEGLPPAVKHFPNATHEFMIYALNAADSDKIDPDNPPKRMPMLFPADAVVQFIADSDEQAHEVLRLAVKTICEGHASPDSDYRAFWKKAIPATALHAQGKCPGCKDHAAVKPRTYPKRDTGLH